MINRIEISGYATYKDPVNFDFSAGKGNPTNMAVIYGPNGTGKSTFARLLRERIENPSENSHVFITHNMGDSFVKRVLIYDKQFVLENFEESDTQPGFFSLGKASIEAENLLKETERRCSEVKEKVDNIQADIGELEQKRKDIETGLGEELFEIKRKYEKTNLSFCLEGVRNSKSKLLAKMLNLEAPAACNETIQMLMHQAAVTQAQDVPKPPNFYLEETRVENDEIWGQAIVPIGESCYKAIIDRLKSHKWIIEGIKYAEQMNGYCPFCQQELNPNTINGLKLIFDKTYENSRAKIVSLENSYMQYESNWKNIKKEWNGFVEKCDLAPIRSQLTAMVNNINTACDICADNMRHIRRKIESPESVITLTSTKPYIDFCKTQFKVIERLYQEVTDTKDISDRFWKIVRNEYEGRIQAFRKIEKELTLKLVKKQEAERNLSGEYSSLCEKVKTIKEKLYSYEYSVQNINKSLEELGVLGFSLVVVGENEAKKYRIVRDENESDKDVYRSLSEGEKTIITLLYFCELCRNMSESLQNDDIVVLLDDPVSSLSANHVYNISQIIKERLVTGNNQVILLTHSIFFVYEIYRVMKKIKPDYFFLSKISNQTNSMKLNGEFSISLYDSYWEELCKIKAENWKTFAPPQTLNIMRNIIERFFGFIERTDLSKDHSKMDELSAEDKAFYRKIDRESHSDMKNESRVPILFADIWRQFQEYFIHKGYKEYFNLLCSATEKRLGIENQSSEQA